MQNLAHSNNKNGGNAQVQSIIIIAITLFALAGAILGFSLGALTHHSTSSSPNANNATTSANKNAKSTQAATSPTPAPSPTAPAQKLDGPAISTSTLLAGTYKYSFTVQALYMGTTTPVKTNGVTCRLWITQSDPHQLGSSNSFKKIASNIASLTQIVPDEVPGGLQFDNATLQTQPCKNGMGTWNVNFSTTLTKGTYYVVGLTDWNGTFYNWSWIKFVL